MSKSSGNMCTWVQFEPFWSKTMDLWHATTQTAAQAGYGGNLEAIAMEYVQAEQAYYSSLQQFSAVNCDNAAAFNQLSNTNAQIASNIMAASSSFNKNWTGKQPPQGPNHNLANNQVIQPQRIQHGYHPQTSPMQHYPPQQHYQPFQGYNERTDGRHNNHMSGCNGCGIG
jgi:hypothetical protein